MIAAALKATPGAGSRSAGRDRRLMVGPRPALVGIVNVTPDSFSDGGLFATPQAAVEHGLQLEAEGADVLDVGGESTRPGSDPVAEDEELARVLPVIEALAGQADAPISIDTRRAAVAREAAGGRRGHRQRRDRPPGRPRHGPPPWPRPARAWSSCTCSASRGPCRTGPRTTIFWPTSAAVCGTSVARAATPACRKTRIMVDPGIGFGKTLAHNLRDPGPPRANCGTLGRPIMVGLSRKRFIGDLAGVAAPAERTFGTAAACALAVAAGALLLRVHDVAAMRQALAVAAAVTESMLRAHDQRHRQLSEPRVPDLPGPTPWRSPSLRCWCTWRTAACAARAGPASSAASSSCLVIGFVLLRILTRLSAHGASEFPLREDVPVMMLLAIILFQPELRRSLMRLGAEPASAVLPAPGGLGVRRPHRPGRRQRSAATRSAPSSPSSATAAWPPWPKAASPLDAEL